MQIVSLGDNLHGVKFFFLGKIRKYFKMPSVDIFTQHAKYYELYIYMGSALQKGVFGRMGMVKAQISLLILAI